MHARGNVNPATTEILIMTTAEFKTIIESEIQEFTIHYYILDASTVMEAACNRLKIFGYENIERYDKILYLDTDIIIGSDMNKLLDKDIQDDKLYVAEEGNLGGDSWGWWLFEGSGININTSAFSTSVMFFRNSVAIKNLFQDIQDYIFEYIHIKNNPIPICLEQPFVIYKAITQNKYDNQLIKPFVLNIYFEISSSQMSDQLILYHFPGQLGNYHSKSERMSFMWGIINKI